MGGKYCLRKTIMCFQVIYFLFVLCLNFVLPLLLCIIFPTILDSISYNGRNKWCFNVEDVESRVGEIGSLWWNQFHDWSHDCLTREKRVFLVLKGRCDKFWKTLYFPRLVSLKPLLTQNHFSLKPHQFQACFLHFQL